MMYSTLQDNRPLNSLMHEKKVYLFEEGNAQMTALLGSKGANLCEMARLGLPVPPGFILTTKVCAEYFLSDHSELPAGLMTEIQKALSQVELKMNRRFGDAENPLLLSVRSGAPVSMPGMMDTILNLGLNDQTLQGLIRQSGNERFAYDTYRRFVQMFGSVALGIHADAFEDILNNQKKLSGVQDDTALKTDELRSLVDAFKNMIADRSGLAFPEDPLEQLQQAVASVFGSWKSPRAVAYRKHMNLDHHSGTAVNIQAMVFGNMGDTSATGVAFSRNPATGEKALYGEYLLNAQGEDVVAGTRTPNKLQHLACVMPAVFDNLLKVTEQLQHHYKDMQDVEFTIENNILYLLQTRTAKRTIQAAIKLAVDFTHEGLITPEEALLRVNANQLVQMFMPAFHPESVEKAREQNRLLAKGLSASPGAATGELVFNSDEAVSLSAMGRKVILARPETCPDDIHGMITSEGVLTSRGGYTSHAAVIARGIGKPSIVGCESCQIDVNARTMSIGNQYFTQGAVISIDGATGEVFQGTLKTIPAEMSEALNTLLGWADDRRRMDVRANVDTPTDAGKALAMGAEGIGLCRTEHMFMASDRLTIMQDMILADNALERTKSLSKLLPLQRKDFKSLFHIMAGHAVTIRLLDPPLHEFLPEMERHQLALARQLEADPYHPDVERQTAILQKLSQLQEVNPMMGFRGCRIGLVYPEIYEMQITAIFEATCDLWEEGVTVQPEIMIPLVGHLNELRILRAQLEVTATQVMQRRNIWFHYLFGTMIEVPRAALTADEIALSAEFFSFGTNDLTQLTLGHSRDDAERTFLKQYLEKGILQDNPFEVLDTTGVGTLLKMACTQGRIARSGLKLGLCGEHGGESRSVQFCHQIGLDYVSCSPFRVPTAKLAAAQAAILEQQSGNDFASNAES